MGKRRRHSGSRSFGRLLALLILIGIVVFLLWLFGPVIPTWIRQNQIIILTIVSGFVLAYSVFRFIFDKPRHSLSKFLLWIFLLASLGYLLWIYVIPPVLLWIRQHLAIIVLSTVAVLLAAVSLVIWRSKPDTWKSILTRIKTLFGPDPPPPPPPPPPEAGGYIYVCRCPALEDNLHKIGKTKRHPKARIIEINAATGVPEEFFLEEHWKVTNCTEAESKTFKALDSYRPNKKREFFKAKLTIILLTISDTIKDLIINEEPDEEYGGPVVIPTSPPDRTVPPVNKKISEREELDTDR